MIHKKKRSAWEINNSSSTAVNVGKKSFVPYLKLFFGAIAALLIIVVAVSLLFNGKSLMMQVVPGIIMLVLLVLYVVYRFLLMKSYKLFFDDEGVWLYSGILPWKKGTWGIKWRDIDYCILLSFVYKLGV